VSLYRIAQTAQRDLETIWCFIGSFDPAAADRWLETVQQRFHLLATHPHVGQGRPDLTPELRFLPVGNYLIFYRSIENGVEIVRVLHGARDYGPEFC